jgi:hypothetical protein
MWGAVPGAYRQSRKTKRRSGETGEVIPRAIQMYRWWFRYLQLALELENSSHYFIQRKRIPKTKHQKKGTEELIKWKVVVNRERYKEWDLDEVMTCSFDKWWKTHSDLFIESPTHAKEIRSAGEILNEEHFRYFQVDTRMTVKDTVQSIREMLQTTTGRRARKRTSKWIATGEIRDEKLHNCYNTLVMAVQGKSNEEILSSGLFRQSRGREINYIVNVGSGGTQSSNLKYHTRTKYERNKRTGELIRKSVSGKKLDQRGSKENLDRMRELVLPAKQLVLMTADGYFAKHPRNKQYLGK